MPDPLCSFCRREKSLCKHMVASPDGSAAICERCAAQAHEIVDKALVKTKEKTKAEAPPVPLPPDIYAFLCEHVIGQDRAKRDVAVAMYQHYRRREVAEQRTDTGGVEIQKSNILMLGPSGSGKTEIARTMAKMLRVPFYAGDATKLTAAGYVGGDVEDLLLGLLRAANGDPDQAEWGILFVDEIDKLARKSGRNSSGYKDIGGESVQQALLTILEGGHVQFQPRGAVSQDEAVTMAKGLKTHNILVIAAGSFAGIEETVERRINKKAALGFGAVDRKKASDIETYSNIIKDDVLEFGMIPEFMGRMPVLTSTYPLTLEEMQRILTEPKNALTKQMQALFGLDGVKLVFEEAALKAIAEEAKKLPTGARELRSIVTRVLAASAFEAPGLARLHGLQEIHITAESVTGNCLPKQVYKPGATPPPTTMSSPTTAVSKQDTAARGY